MTTWATLRVAGKHGGLAGFAVSAVFLLTSGLPPQPLGPSVIAIALGGLLGFAMMLTIGGRPSPEGVDPTWLGVGETLKLARARFLNRAPLRHHALRLGVATSAAVLGYRLLDLSYGYWVALTVLAILQPDPHGTRVRALQRSSGTMIGILIAAAFVYLTGDPWILAAAASLLALLLFAVRDSSYHLLVMLLTPTALLMVSTVSYSGIDIAGYRVVNTAIGILVALAASWLMWGHERIGPPPPAPKPG
uniref:Unannotated protein n=1 Tax=freshwater metagenome TaxID=449393 RepID=A0A6J5ZSA1_9ZZZZ